MMPEREAEIVLDANSATYSRYNGLSADQIRANLPLIRKQKYAVDDGRLVEGISALAVPILPGPEDVAGALAVNMTNARLKPARLKELLAMMRREVELIEAAIGG